MTHKILVVDDDPYIRTFLNKRLTTAGFTVLLAEDGTKGLALAKDEQPGVIITDWNMPNMSGKEFCKIIKSDDTLKYTYVILLTARDSTDDKVEGMEYGADDFVTKPFYEKELIARIKVGHRIGALQEELAKFQHQKALMELAITIGHEINNPLGAVMLTLQVMKKKIGSDRFEGLMQDIEMCIANGIRVSDIVKKLCSLEEPQLKPYLEGSSVNMIDLSNKS